MVLEGLLVEVGGEEVVRLAAEVGQGGVGGLLKPSHRAQNKIT